METRLMSKSKCYLTWSEDGHLQCSVNHRDRSNCLLSVWDETADDYKPPCDVASCLEPAVGWATLTEYESGRSAYGCLDHIDKTVVAFQNGAWRGALMNIRHLDSGKWESVERMPTPADVLNSLGRES
jgi:hypothetical protein